MLTAAMFAANAAFSVDTTSRYVRDPGGIGAREPPLSQRVALVDELIVRDPQFDDPTGNFRCHRDDIGAHGGIASPRRFDIDTPHLYSQHHGPGYAGQGQQQPHDFRSHSRARSSPEP